MDKRHMKTEEFLTRAKKIHGDRYDYDGINNPSYQCKITIVCKEHGKFIQRTGHHLDGHGCKKCSVRLTNNEFQDKSKLIHGDKFSYHDDFRGYGEYVSLTCREHGKFRTDPYYHLSYVGGGCPKCGMIQKQDRGRNSWEEVMNRFISIHGKKYDYSKSAYVTSDKKVEIICKKHGSFFQSPHQHIRGQGCPKCCRSKGELLVEKWLEEKEITYVVQMTFAECCSPVGRKLKFDFYLPRYNTLIEVDGPQHYGPVNFRGHQITIEEYKRCVLYDELKTKYAFENNIRLIRVPYRNNDDVKNIPILLEKLL